MVSCMVLKYLTKMEARKLQKQMQWGAMETEGEDLQLTTIHLFKGNRAINNI